MMDLMKETDRLRLLAAKAEWIASLSKDQQKICILYQLAADYRQRANALQAKSRDT
jgi:hypothetical protein